MPKTYAELRDRHHLGPDAYDPRDNVLAGVDYQREMLDRYGSPGFLAACNAGPLRYDQHMAAGRTLPAAPRPNVAMPSPMISGRKLEDRAVASFDVVAWDRAALSATHSARSPVVGLSTPRVRAVRSPGVRSMVDLMVLSMHSKGLFARLASRGQRRPDGVLLGGEGRQMRIRRLGRARRRVSIAAAETRVSERPR
jgi:hypothetical protein